MRSWNLPARLLSYVRNVYRMGRAAQQQCDVSLWRMMREHWRLRKLNELRIGEYFAYGLFDPDMPWEAKTEYVGGKLMRRLWSALNPIEYRWIFKDKLVFKRLCQGMGLPTAELLGVFDPDWGYDAAGNPLRTADDLRRWIGGLEDANVVFKPTAGAEGEMVRVFGGKTEASEPALLDLEGTPRSAQELYDYFTDDEKLAVACSGAPQITPTFLIERRLRSHPELARLSPETLCTVRLVTLRDREPKIPAHVVAAEYKIQTGSTGADNVALGALPVGVDAETGVLGTGVHIDSDTGVAFLQRVEVVPSSGQRFTGTQIPLWADTLALATRAADSFPYARAVGWDIAVTPEGPRIVEGNWAWGEKGAQGGPNRGLYHGDFKHVCDRLIREGKADRALV